MSVAAIATARPEYIAVDLDGTLVLTDTFVSTLLEALRKHPSQFLMLLMALLRGRAYCKRLAVSLAPIDIPSLPYNEPLIDYLRQQKAAGRRLILATGADISIARSVADYLGIFHEVIATKGGRNVTGDEKVRAIREQIGDTPFVYAGNSRSDLAVWHRSESAILVGAPRSCARELRRAGIVVQHEIALPKVNWSSLLRCLRWHQWAKNTLVFLPLIVSHQILNPLMAGDALIAFAALSCCASALYIVNDFLDLQADRLHPTKRLRPLASGAMTMGVGAVVAGIMALAACGLALLSPVEARFLLAGYAVASLSYSLKLKRLLYVDVVTLALFYTFRVWYGGAVTGIKISVWTLAFSLFLFTSLATIKRLTELRRVNASGARTQEYRGYREVDTTQLCSLASSAGFAAVLVLALYINSPEVQLLYRNPQVLWLLCPVLVYWISRLSLIANRGHVDDDPVTFAMKDRATWVTGVVAGIIIVLST